MVAVPIFAPLTSPDGIAWTQRNSGTDLQLSGVTYGNGFFVAVGLGVILTSKDGEIWTLRDSAGVDKTFLFGVTYGNGTFIAVGLGAVGYEMMGYSGVILQSDSL
ncbi:MAG: hypothetical protein M1497_04455 [Nitrospirae bacterium]|nr:hypothetical protein [Nitrospirota bacterium]